MNKKVLLLFLFPLILSLTNCSNSSRFSFKLWNECDSLNILKEFVKDVTNKNSVNFIPVKDRIATFDMDGTFIGELYPTYFEYLMFEYRVLEDPNYKNIAPSDVVSVAETIRAYKIDHTPFPSGFDVTHAHAAAKAYAGMSINDFDAYTKEFAKRTPAGFIGMTYATSFYKPMLEIFEYLDKYQFTSYVVSGSDRFICRALVESLGIQASRVIGMDVALKSTNQGDTDGVKYTQSPEEELFRTDELIIKNLKENKVKQISQEIGKTPVLSFGNSSGDAAMHNYCMGNTKYKSKVFMLIADDNIRDHADLEETAKRETAWKEAKYNIISMHDDFKTIYGNGVEVVPFSYIYNE